MEAGVLISELAGLWYVDDAEKLAREIDGYLAAAESGAVGQVIALLLPHAGYGYSGMVAAHGIKLIAGQPFRRVIVIGPSHRTAMMDAVSMPDVSFIQTPLGRIAIDRDVVEQLWADDHFQSHLHAHTDEHSVQIELPLLQRALGDFSLVPIVCGHLSETSARAIAAALRNHIDEETLVVVSSDFTHYGRAFDYVPFHDNIPGNLRNLDLGAFRELENKDLPGFLRYVHDTGATICGRSPIAVLLAMLPAEADVHLLKYDTSGNLTGDWSRCVSYVSAAVTGTWAATCSDGTHCERPVEWTDTDKVSLLRLARHAIENEFGCSEPDLGIAITPPMQEIMGAFVSLHKHGQLRGCLGEILPRRELYEAVREQAVNAAFHDPRFPGLRRKELDDIDIEISALTVPRRVGSYTDIEVGRHGIMLYKGSHSAVFLPQVAPEQGWGLEETLMHLACKAGLGPDDWQSDCEFHVFEAIVFSEGRH